MQIYHLKHEQINKNRWDQNISKSINGTIYAFSWYLDAVSPGWEALVNLDYTFVMPLTVKRKMGISYMPRPLLSQQLGVFSQDLPSQEIVSAFIQAIPKHIKLIEITLNKFNTAEHDGFQSSQHTSYELELIQNYRQLAKHYAKNNSRNIAKAHKNSIRIEPAIHPNEFLALLMKDESAGSRILRKTGNLGLISGLVKTMHTQQTGLLYGSYNADDQLVAACLFGVSHNKIYYLVPVNSPEGRESRAIFAILDHLIQSFSGKAYILDFEGSDIPGLARIYAGFGAQPISYSFIRCNKMPWPLKLLKKG